MIKLHLFPEFDRSLLPIPAKPHKDWWQDNDRTRNHAQHCLPLAMANSLGYYILSPTSFTVSWNGNVQEPAEVAIIDDMAGGCHVTAHAAYGCFVVQPGFIPMTPAVGDFLFVKGIPNERACPYSCMEAAIEAWWSVGQFGLVYLLNQPGKFNIAKGQPIAQMFILRQEGAFASTAVEVIDGMPPGHDVWTERRHRRNYSKDKDYLQGRHADQHQEPTHIMSWRGGNHPE